MVKLQGDFYFSFDTSTKRSEQPQGDFFARIALQREYWPIRHRFATCFVNYKKGCTRPASASDKVYQMLISVFQTAIVKGRNRNSYEYKNCITDPYSGKITSVLFHFLYLGFDGDYPKGLLTLWIWLVSPLKQLKLAKRHGKITGRLLLLFWH
jgi:hypothetical protein